MDKKIILITGASSGIGKETAMTLAKQGHQLIIHGRDTEKTKSVFNEIKAATGNHDIEWAEKIGLGTRKYRIVSIDK